MKARIHALCAAALLACGVSQADAQKIVVNQGVAAYVERGDAREAIRLLTGAIDGGSLSQQDQLRVAVYMAHAFLALGDTVSARPHIRRALEIQPCLLPADEFAPPAWRDLYDKARQPQRRCTHLAFSSTLKSLIVPGWGQLSQRRGAAGTSFLVLTVGSAAVAGGLWDDTRTKYDEYKSATHPQDAARLYDEANDSYRLAQGFAISAALLWLWNVQDALRWGVTHDRNLSAVRRYVVIPEVTPRDGSVQLGFTVSF